MSKEPRGVPFTTYLEATLWALAQTAVAQDNTTASSYLRKLILNDLKKKGILTPDIMMTLLDGTGLEKIVASQAAQATAEEEALAQLEQDAQDAELETLVSAKQT